MEEWGGGVEEWGGGVEGRQIKCILKARMENVTVEVQ